jgi:peptide/nickel transport system substrate-binding protein
VGSRRRQRHVSNGLHNLTTDTLWFIDPDAGVEGASENAVYNSLADDPVAVQRRLHGNDREAQAGHLRGATASASPPTDVVYHRPEAEASTPGTPYNGAFTAPGCGPFRGAGRLHGPLQVLNAPNSRFHALFCSALDGGLDHAQARL